MTEPTTVTREQQRAAYDALGLDPDLYKKTKSVLIDAWKVTVTRYRPHPVTGGTYLDDNYQPAVDVTVMELVNATAALQ